MKIQPSRIVQGAMWCLMTFVGVSSFAAPVAAAKPAHIHLFVSVPQSTIQSTLEEAVPAKIESADEYEQYGVHFRNLKITRRRFKFE